MNQRPELHVLEATEWDVIVIGGGITGAGVAREAARRGLKTLLLEQKDFAWGTSSRSSKMVHGGLRYIAAGDIRLTWHSLVERERLLREAPGLVTRLGYWFAHYRKVFPGPLVFRMLLIVYDLLARVRDHSYRRADAFLKVIPGYRSASLLGASRYTDAVVDDARLVVRVLEEACADGALVRNYSRVTDLVLKDGLVRGVHVQDVDQPELSVILKARAVVNATGAWADRLREPLAGERRVRPLRGSHLVVSATRLPAKEAVIFMHPDDGRAVFIYPWEGRTLIGTTDLDHRQDLDEEASLTTAELQYMLRAANHEFPQAQLVASDVIATFSGVRPIVASGKSSDPSSEKRDHSVFLDQGLVTVTGGKLTTFRQIALDALKAAAPFLGVTIRDDGGAVFRAVPEDPAVPAVLRARYGRHAHQVADLLSHPEHAEQIPELDHCWGELLWSLRQEQVVHLDDLVLRRVRMGILLVHGGKAFWARMAQMCQKELGWSDGRVAEELERMHQIWQNHYSLPSEAL